MTYEELCAIEAKAVLAWYWSHFSIWAEECDTVYEAFGFLDGIEEMGGGSTVGIEVFAADGEPVMFARSAGKVFIGKEWSAAEAAWKAEKAAVIEGYKVTHPRADADRWLVEVEPPDIVVSSRRASDLGPRFESESDAVEAAAIYGGRAKVVKRSVTVPA